MIDRRDTFADTVETPDVAAGCTGKKRYDGPFSAARALKAIKKRRSVDRGAAVYRCRHCDGYHIGRS